MLSEATSVSRMTRRTSGDVRVAHLSQIGEELVELRVVRRYLGLDVLARARIRAVPDSTVSAEEVTATETIPALGA
jgi:hypothetical protein